MRYSLRAQSFGQMNSDGKAEWRFPMDKPVMTATTMSHFGAKMIYICACCHKCGQDMAAVSDVFTRCKTCGQLCSCPGCLAERDA